MIKVSPQRNVSLPIAHELSGLTSLREPDSVLRQYIRSNKVNNQNSSDSEAIRNLARSVEKIRRRILGGSGGSSSDSLDTGEWDPTRSYKAHQRTVIRAGANAGEFLCLIDHTGQNPTMPDTGNLYWLSLSGNAPVMGAWMT
jgi:hypothetical protein